MVAQKQIGWIVWTGKFTGSLPKTKDFDLIAQEVFGSHIYDLPWMRRKNLRTIRHVRTLILENLKRSGAINLNIKGLYFTPVREPVDQAKEFLLVLSKNPFAGLPPLCAEFFSVPVAQMGKTEMEVLVEKYLLEEVAKIALFLEKNQYARPKTYEDKLGDVDVLEERLCSYHGILNPDTAKQELEKLREIICLAIARSLEKFPQSKEFPYQARVRYFGDAVEERGKTGTVVGYSKDGKEVRVFFHQVGEVITTGVSVLVLEGAEPKGMLT